MSIDIVLVDDHLPFRACLKALLGRQPDFVVVAEADHGGQVVDALMQAVRTPSNVACVILMDVDMPVVDGIEGTRRVVALAASEQVPTYRVLALSSHDDPSLVAAMVAAGARGYLLKDDPFDGLVQAIRDVAAGLRVFSPLLEAKPAPHGDSVN